MLQNVERTCTCKVHQVTPCIRQLRPQFERQSKIRCPTETTRSQPFSSQLTKLKTVSKLMWPLQVVNLKIWRGKAYFVQDNTIIISYLTTLDELRARCHAESRRCIFGAKLTAWRHKICHIFHFLQSDMVFGIVSHFLCIFNPISTEKRGLISVPFLTC